MYDVLFIDSVLVANFLRINKDICHFFSAAQLLSNAFALGAMPTRGQMGAHHELNLVKHHEWQ